MFEEIDFCFFVMTYNSEIARDVHLMNKINYSNTMT